MRRTNLTILSTSKATSNFTSAAYRANYQQKLSKVFLKNLTCHDANSLKHEQLEYRKALVRHRLSELKQY
ncbi:hypothetical protein N7447_008866 [Penicillium robsamsonii]|uniref:uncharacterized protein n=1 Tax=Penicillium robsamsonii TaxID=1792511 RepID=UPI002546B80E|nr:uncharacterized protein N7447_008866 [Penicillium robsamsonii]KAJ5816633.1 hypothetical protein N7447_008866 [Penicillium robsamsonii]